MLEGLEWAREKFAYCVIFARGLAAPELLHRLGGDPSTARLTGPDERWEVVETLLQQFNYVVQVGWCEGWAFAYEYNGLPPGPETMRALSAGTAAVSVFCNVNAVTRFCYAEDGVLVANFDPIEVRSQEFFRDASPQVLALLGQAGITRFIGEDEYDFDERFDFVGAMHALAEAVGVRLDRASIAEKPLLCAGIPVRSLG
jgi:hypothetical protein